jgi:hypothetical protein
MKQALWSPLTPLIHLLSLRGRQKSQILSNWTTRTTQSLTMRNLVHLFPLALPARARSCPRSRKSPFSLPRLYLKNQPLSHLPLHPRESRNLHCRTVKKKMIRPLYTSQA